MQVKHPSGRKLKLGFACLMLLLASCSRSSSPDAAGTTQTQHWVSTWGAATTAIFPIGYNTDLSTLTNTPAIEHTFRVIARTTLGGSAVRIRLTNQPGLTPITIGSVRIGLRSSGAAVTPGSTMPVTFNGASNIVIPAGVQIISDPVQLSSAAGDDIAVSIYLPLALTPAIHAQAFQTNYVTPSDVGDATADESGAAFTLLITSVPVLEGIDVLTQNKSGSIVVLGDSLSDGVGSTFDGYDRWPDLLSKRLQSAGIARSVVNMGLTGNNIQCPIALPQDGPNAMTRLDRDVLSKSGISVVFVFAGTNDLSNFCTAAQLQSYITALVARIHARGIPVIGATILPRIDIHFTAQAMADRLIVNDWIRNSQVYDYVVDFDAAVRASDGGWDPQYDSGDQVHLNPAGYRKLAEAIDLSLLASLPPIEQP